VLVRDRHRNQADVEQKQEGVERLGVHLKVITATGARGYSA
jgi:hypothetical protein